MATGGLRAARMLHMARRAERNLVSYEQTGESWGRVWSFFMVFSVTWWLTTILDCPDQVPFANLLC